MKVDVAEETKCAVYLEVEKTFIVVFGETKQKGKEIAEVIKKALEAENE